MKTPRLHSQCITCLMNKFLKKIENEQNEDKKLRDTQTLLRLLSEASLYDSAPVIMNRIEQQLGEIEHFDKEKVYFNALMLKKTEKIKQNILSAVDRLKTAVSYALLGNYIDFGALDSVNEDDLNKRLNTLSVDFNETELHNLKKDLSTAKTLVYLTDNCGEIVLDRLLIETIKVLYPAVNITVLVKGSPVLNDATIEDAEQIGLTDIVSVLPNGSGIAGTHLPSLSSQAKQTIDKADVIISKGQANFETLRHCEKNIYYLFLCKCRLFADRFGVPTYTGMLLNDLRMKEEEA